MLLRIFLIALFGAIGTLARYGVHTLVQAKMGSDFPYGTLLINLSDCFFLGLLGQLTLNRIIICPEWRLAIAVGFFGVVASVVFGILLSIAGIRLANLF